jgi:tRNA (cmo5U34)-methyltransferase
VSVPAASQAFSAHAPEYTALRRRLVPDFDEFYGTAVAALQCGLGPLERVLDLGAGTGLMAAAVASRYPEARFELLDGSEAMLVEAQAVLGERVSAMHVQDMALGLPEGPFDAVVSALAIHHLEDADKRLLFRRIHELLRPSGVFVNAEQVVGPSESVTSFYHVRWIAECRAAGATQAEIDDALTRRQHDRCADLESQLQWLQEAGFAVADCIYKSGERAVILAIKED